MDSVAAENIVKLVANHVNQEVTPENPLVSAELPGSGFRFEGIFHLFQKHLPLI